MIASSSSAGSDHNMQVHSMKLKSFKKGEKNENFTEIWRLAALYLAAALPGGMVGFLTVLDFLSMTDPGQKVALFVGQPGDHVHTAPAHVCGLWRFSGCPGAGAVRPVEGRLTGHHAGGNRLRDDLGAALIFASGMITQRRDATCRRSLWQRPGPGCDVWQAIDIVATGLGHAMAKFWAAYGFCWSAGLLCGQAGFPRA